MIQDKQEAPVQRKPKVYWIAGVSAVMVAALVILFQIGGREPFPISSTILAVYFFSVTAQLLWAFFRQLRYNLYSYNTIIYFGFAVFTSVIAVMFTILLILLWNVPSEAMLATALSRLANSAELYMLLTFPILLVLSVALVVSNLSLIRHEGFRPVNLLGILLAFLVVGGEVLVYALNFSMTGSMTEVMFQEMGTNVLAAAYLYFECMLTGTVVADILAVKRKPDKDRDYIIVLGCAIRKDGTPTPLLRDRLDRALEFAREQEAETGKAPVFVLSGGQGADECVSEATSMRRYLEEKGVPAERLLLEDRSTDTAENMRFSKALIDAQDPDALVAFSTTNYHVFRSGIYARRVKLHAQGMGCKAKWYFWPNAAVREFVGLLTRHRLKQGLILGGLLLLTVIFTVVKYQI